MRYFIYQGNDNDCGFASMKMLLALVNKNPGFLYLDKPTKRERYTFSDLIAIAKDYGLFLKAYEYESKSPLDIKTPFLALIDGNHLVLVKEMRKKKVIVYDPAEGTVALKHVEFSKRWNKMTLEIDHFEKQNFVKKKPELLPLKKRIVSLLFSFLSIASLLVGFFFIKNDVYIFIPVIMLALFAIFELVEKWYLIKEIYFFDNLYMPKYFAKNNDDAISKYKEYTNRKKDFFQFDRKAYSSFGIIAVFIFVLVFNNLWNAIAVIFLLLLALSEKQFFKSKDNEKELNLTKLENTLVKGDNKNLIPDLLSISESSNSFALRLSTRKCVNAFIIILLSLGMMIISKEISVNFVIFNFGLFVILFDNIDSALGIGDKSKKYLKEKMRFLDQCIL